MSDMQEIVVENTPHMFLNKEILIGFAAGVISAGATVLIIKMRKNKDVVEDETSEV